MVGSSCLELTAHANVSLGKKEVLAVVNLCLLMYLVLRDYLRVEYDLSPAS